MEELSHPTLIYNTNAHMSSLGEYDKINGYSSFLTILAVTFRRSQPIFSL